MSALQHLGEVSREYQRVADEYRPVIVAAAEAEVGLDYSCACGCGTRPPLAARTDKHKGWVKGLPRPLVPGHIRPRFPGDPDFSRPSGSTLRADYGDERLPARFWDKVYPEPNTGCWLWGAAATSEYGLFWISGVAVLRYAHRVTWESLVGPVADGLELDHLCRVRACCRPAHLEPVTHDVNVARGAGPSIWRAAFRKPRCVRGHEFSHQNSKGHWLFRECKNITQQARRAGTRSVT